MEIFISELIFRSQTILPTDHAKLIMSLNERVIISDPTALRIAQNNIAICLIFFIPTLGAFFMAFVGFNTGRLISATALLSSSATPFQHLQLVFLTPSTWLEVIAHSLAVSEGTILFLGALMSGLRKAGKNLLKTILVTIALLSMSAIFESIIIAT